MSTTQKGIQQLHMQLHLRDADALVDAFQGWEGSIVQVSPGSFRGSLALAGGPNLRAFSAVTNQALLTRGDADCDCVTFIPVSRENESTRWRSRYLKPGSLLIKGSEIGYHNQTEPNSRITGLVLRKKLVSKAVAILAPDRAEQDWTTWSALQPDPHATLYLERRINSLLNPKESQGRSAFTHDLEAEIIRILCNTLVTANGDPFKVRPHNRAKLVSQATSYMHDRLTKPLTAMDLCSAFGVSDRLLRVAFNEAYGMGPLSYFRVMRLNAVRDALRAKRGRDETVASTLVALGVTRPSAFAGEYSRHFGELPSVTLGVRGWNGVQSMTREMAKL